MSRRKVVYTPRINELKVSGRYYEANGKIRSIVTKDKIYKDLSGWGGDIDLAYECYEIWKSKGYTGSPSSPVSFFRKNHTRGRVKATYNNMIRKCFHGGWIDAFNKGTIARKVYEYDINKAYLWASSLGYPKYVFPYRKGDENYFVLMETNGKNKHKNIPRYLKKSYIIASNEDIETYNLEGDILRGVSFSNDKIYTNRELEEFKYLPEKAYKLLTQGFWGIWGQDGKLLSYTLDKNGEYKKPVETYNRYQNLVWAFITVRRVMRKIYEVAKEDAVHVFVDSVLRVSEIDNDLIGDEMGKFKIKNIYEKGVYIKHAGAYDTLPYAKNSPVWEWEKHAGFYNKSRKNEEKNVYLEQ